MDKLWSYLPSLEGYINGDVFKTVSGTPTVSSGSVVLNAAVITSLQVFREVCLTMQLTIPTAPTTGDTRVFGLGFPGTATYRIAFEITDTTFRAAYYDKTGTLVDSYIITWSSAWTNTSALFQIRTTNRQIFFLINETVVARFNEVGVVKVGLHVNISNSNSDNLLCGAVNAQDNSQK